MDKLCINHNLSKLAKLWSCYPQLNYSDFEKLKENNLLKINIKVEIFSLFFKLSTAFVIGFLYEYKFK